MSKYHYRVIGGDFDYKHVTQLSVISQSKLIRLSLNDENKYIWTYPRQYYISTVYTCVHSSDPTVILWPGYLFINVYILQF